LTRTSYGRQSEKIGWFVVPRHAGQSGLKIADVDLTEKKGGNMTELFREKFTMDAEGQGWSIARAQGYMDGESSRRRGKSPSKYVLVGIDEYCLGFRAGYFERQRPGSVSRADLEGR
jgi:hypothetical protein